MIDQNWDPALVKGLRELAADSFPKRCANCGRKFADAVEFMRETESLQSGRVGFKQSRDDDEQVILELFRNCPCGSTLMEFFGNRRDDSEKGGERRHHFRQLQDYLVTRGVDAQLARQEILKVLQGGESELLSHLQPPTQP
jgi:hypothetical protein